MRTGEPRRVSLIWIILGAVVIALIVFDISYGQGAHDNCNGNSCIDGEVAAVLTGDEFRALSLSQALGGVEVSGCVVTTQWGIVIWQHQGYKYDVFCLARELDVVRKYADAAAMRCLHKIPTKLYGERCLSVMNFEPPELDLTKTLVGQVPRDNTRYEALLERLDKYEDERQETNRSYAVQQQQQYEVIQQQVENAAAERRAKSRSAYADALAAEALKVKEGEE